jgi:hypothetical protein
MESLESLFHCNNIVKQMLEMVGGKSSLVILCGSSASCLGDASFHCIYVLEHADYISWM